VSWDAGLAIVIDGEVSRLSLIEPGSSTNAAFGAESADGVGVPVLEVVQRAPPPVAFAAVHPAGNAGAATPSKLWLNTVLGAPRTRIDAEALADPAFVLVTEAVLASVAPQVALEVSLTTWAWVLV
jgi:hypothetical protein